MNADIGIVISPTACRVMAKRLRDVCGVLKSWTSTLRRSWHRQNQ